MWKLSLIMAFLLVCAAIAFSEEPAVSGSRQEWEEGANTINGFIGSQQSFGNYASCRWWGDSYALRPEEQIISFYAMCDGETLESIRLVLENDEVKEAFFQNSEEEVYMKIYPEKVVLTERNPGWERNEESQKQSIEKSDPLGGALLIGVFALIALAVIALSLYKNKH